MGKIKIDKDSINETITMYDKLNNIINNCKNYTTTSYITGDLKKHYDGFGDNSKEQLELLSTNISNAANIARVSLNIYDNADKLSNEYLEEVVNTIFQNVDDSNIEFSDDFNKFIVFDSNTGLQKQSINIENKKINVWFKEDKNGIVDYSVDLEDLEVYKTITTNDGNTYDIYKSSKTNALYIISSIPDNNKNNIIKKDLYVSLKDVLNEDEMVIITFDGNPYKGNVYDSHKSTNDFGFVAKNDNGKMLAFYNTAKRVSEIPRKEVIVTYKGLAMPYNCSISVETGASFDMSVLYQNEYARNPNTKDLIINKQAGLVACQLFVQKNDPVKARKIQDDTARFVIKDAVLEQFCDRYDNETSFLTATNRNEYGKVSSYHTVFEGCGETFKDKYPEGYLGSHSNVFDVTLETYHQNNRFNNFCFTLEAISPDGVVCQKEMWTTTNSYMVDDWNDLKIK